MGPVSATAGGPGTAPVLTPDPPPAFQRSLIAGTEGRSLGYVEAGSGPAVVLIHGALTHLDDMRLSLMDALALDHRVIAFDRPGHGASPRRPWADASPWVQARLIADATRALGAERPVVVGHSFGGAVAMAWAMAFPDSVAGVVALAPLVWPEPRLELALFGPRAAPSGALVDRAATLATDPLLLPPLWRAMFLPQIQPERFRDGFDFACAASAVTKHSTGEDAASALTSLWRSAAAYRSCLTPVRVLAGDCDLVVASLVHGGGLARVLPRGRFERLAGLGHMLHHFASDRVAAAVRELHAGE